MEINLPGLKQALIGQANRTEVISNNLANINTNGFKKDILFFEKLKEEMDADPGAREATYFEQGPLKKTDNPLDFAIAGNGFFTVETESGMAYTREGHFKVNQDGVLRTATGHMVYGYAGPITVLTNENMNPREIAVSKDGEVFADGVYMDRLMITDFEVPNNLQKSGTNLFKDNGNAVAFEVDLPTVQQGFLEGSNVNPAEEMIQLIEVQRQFESIQRMVRTMDTMFKEAVSSVGQYR